MDKQEKFIAWFGWLAVLTALILKLVYPDVSLENENIEVQAVESEIRLDCESLNLEYVGWRTVTCYSSTPDQTDDTPFITATGNYVKDGIIATNEFPFGTKLLIDGKIYIVDDRTNSRYKYRIDIWKPSRSEALECGKKDMEVWIVK